MNDTNNFVYLVMQYDPSMGKEWVMYAFDNVADAEAQVDKVNKEYAPKPALQYFVKAVRYFRKETLHAST